MGAVSCASLGWLSVVVATCPAVCSVHAPAAEAPREAPTLLCLCACHWQAPAYVKPTLFFNSTRADRPASFVVTTGGTIETVIPMLSLASVSGS